MGKRGGIHDYAGEELREGDLVSFAARHGNRVRMSDAVVKEVFVRNVQGQLIPSLRVQPTGRDSGWAMGARQTLAPQEIRAEHVRLITPGFAPQV